MKHVVGACALALVVTLVGALAPAGRAAAEQAPEAMPVLRQRLQQLVTDARVGGEYAIAVTDLQTGESISVNGNRPQLSACSINLIVLALTTLDIQSGRTRQEDVDQLIAATTYSSNASTARDLYAIAGKGSLHTGLRRAAQLIARMGMVNSVLDHAPGFGEATLDRNPNNWLTAVDTNRALRWIWSSGELEPEWREYLLGHLANVKPGLNYLMATAPATVSHKNGFFPAHDTTYVDNDVAIVRFTRKGAEYAYAISFLAQGVPAKYEDVPLGQAVAAEAWAFFSERYP